LSETTASTTRILVAGATGVIGRVRLSLLVAAEHKVIGTTRDPAKLGGLTAHGARPVVDPFDRDALVALFRAERPD